MISLFKVRMQETAILKAVQVLRSGFIGQGKVVDEFEESLKDYFNWPYVVTTNSATSAEHLAFYMLKDKYGGCDVLCTPLTCTATNFPVVLNGYNIKWVDIDKNTLNMSAYDIEDKLSKRTKILYLVHWGGYPIDYDVIDRVLEKFKYSYYFKPVIVEDCAHAMGSEYKGKKLGVYLKGGYATYSFQAIKHVTSIDGGCLLCPDEESYKRAKLLRWYGIDRESNKKDFRCEADISEIGYKFHMNDVSASIGMENLKGLPEDIASRQRCAKYYDKKITTQLVKRIPYNPDCSYWLYTMFVKNQAKFMEHMKKKNIMVSRVHERNDIHSCLSQFETPLPNLDRIVKEMICIPCGPWVTDENLKYITEAINGDW